jgi:hypothetical protein
MQCQQLGLEKSNDNIRLLVSEARIKLQLLNSCGGPSKEYSRTKKIIQGRSTRIF